jgi:hypothetical protein
MMWRRAIVCLRIRSSCYVVGLQSPQTINATSRQSLEVGTSAHGRVAFEILTAILLIKGDCGWDGQGDALLVTAVLFHAPDFKQWKPGFKGEIEWL